MSIKSPMHQRIRFWHRQSEAEFNARVKKEADLPARGIIPPSVLDALSEYERSIHERNQHPVGMFLDLIDMRHLGDRRASTEQLMLVMEVGRDLLLAAICHPDGTDEFLEEARGAIGPVVDTVLNEMGTEYYRRDAGTGEETYHGLKPFGEPQISDALHNARSTAQEDPREPSDGQ